MDNQGKKSDSLRPCDLPIYNTTPVEMRYQPKYLADPPEILKPTLSTVGTCLSKTASYFQTFKGYVARPASKIQSTVISAYQPDTGERLRAKYLDAMVKPVVITTVGLTCFVLTKMRGGGKFKQFFYPFMGITGSTAVCYPKEVWDYAVQGYEYAESKLPNK